MKSKIKILIIFVIMIIVSSCGSNEDDNYGLANMRCDLEIRHATDGGEVAGVGSGIFKKGDKVNLSVTLKENHVLKGWYDYKADTLLCEDLEYSFLIQEAETIIELRYLRTDEAITINADVQRIAGFYKEKKSIMFNVFSSAYEKYKAYIISENVNVADFTLNGENANQQKEIDIINGSTPVTVSYKSKTEGRNTTFKLVVYPVLAPQNKEEYTITMINNGTAFSVTGGGTFTLTKTNASESGHYTTQDYQGSATYSLNCSETETFKIYADPTNSIPEYILSGVSLDDKYTYQNAVNLPAKSGTISIGKGAFYLGSTLIEYRTNFQYQRNMGGSIARKNSGSTEWAGAFTEYICFANQIGYEQKLPVTIKFNKR